MKIAIIEDELWFKPHDVWNSRQIDGNLQTLTNLPDNAKIIEFTEEDFQKRFNFDHNIQTDDVVRITENIILDTRDNIITANDAYSFYDNYYIIQSVRTEPSGLKTVVLNNNWYISAYSVEKIELEDEYKIFIELLTSNTAVYKTIKRLAGTKKIWFNNEDKLARFREGDKIVKTKPGRLVKRYGMATRDVEIFNNRLLSHYIKYETKILSGNDIKWAYLERNYTTGGGQLNNSCMRGESKQSVIDFYANCEKTRLMVFLDDDGKVSARAIIWDLDNGIQMVDRIYTVADTIDYKFKDKCKELGFILREEVNDADKVVTLDIKQEWLDTNGRLNDTNFPYLDTMYNGILMNNKLVLSGLVYCFRHN